MSGSESNTEQPIVVWHQAAVRSEDRESLNGHLGGVVWFTGLSGSGKSTIAGRVEQMLHELGIHTMLLDGDNLRHGLCATPAMLAPQFGDTLANRFGLGFAAEDRKENVRRVGAVCELFAAAGLVTLTALVSPHRVERDRVRAQVESSRGAERFLEVFVNTPIEVCESRDPKGLYQKARAGLIKNFTGIDDPYEPPLAAELTIRGGSVDEAAAQVVDLLRQRGWIGRN